LIEESTSRRVKVDPYEKASKGAAGVAEGETERRERWERKPL